MLCSYLCCLLNFNGDNLTADLALISDVVFFVPHNKGTPDNGVTFPPNVWT